VPDADRDKSSEECQEDKQKADHAFDVQKKDRLTTASSDNVQYITFDWQKSLPLPKLSTSTASYLRQVWLYNIGVHVVSGDIDRSYFHICPHPAMDIFLHGPTPVLVKIKIPLSSACGNCLYYVRNMLELNTSFRSPDTPF